MPTRREFVSASFAALPAAWSTTGTTAAAPARLHVVAVGGHPDDPESGCGGTLATASAAGHRVTVVYLTRGERGIEGATLDAAARTRTGEAESACRILGAAPVFAGQIDGATEFSRDHAERFTTLMRGLQPDIVLTHWPIDTHADHQVASLLSFRAWLALRQSFTLCYFEVNAGEQTRGFSPTDYVDITPVADVKRRAVLAHVSQDGAGIMRDHHVPMATFRGREIGVAQAEAFVRLTGHQAILPLA
jgi:LmbE family N-acetylglucosaminyl deacetylase